MTTNTAEKYELIREDSITISTSTLYRIRALRDIPGVVQAGELGGYISGPESISQDGKCWVHRNANVFDGAQVRDNAQLFEYSTAAAGAIVKDNASMCHAQAFGEVRLANDEELSNGTLLNTTIIRSAHFVRDGWTNFAFSYQSKRSAGNISIPVSACDAVTALELALLRDNGSLVLFHDQGQVRFFKLDGGHLPYAEVLKRL